MLACILMLAYDSYLLYCLIISGRYVHVYHTYDTRNHSTLVSPMYAAPNSNSSCSLSFWYQLSRPSTYSPVKLQVQAVQPGTPTSITVLTTIYSSDYNSSSWESKEVNLDLDESEAFQVGEKFTVRGIDIIVLKVIGHLLTPLKII